MPKSYTEKERAAIIAELKAVALELMMQKGIKKTTVDELVQRVHIPKGTFYLFYESKERLFYDALMQMDELVHLQIALKLKEVKKNFSVDSLVELLNDFFQMAFQGGVLSLMLSGEMEVLIRKLPDEIVSEHISKDDDFCEIFRELFPQRTTEELNVYSAALRAIFFTAAYKREIGENFDEALKLLIRGLVVQM